MNPNQTAPAKEQSYLRNVSSKKVAVTETIAIPAGAAGAVVDFDVTTRPIASLSGADLGGVGNTSFILTSTAFTTLVNPKADADLANGDYYLDHLTGRGRGKKADTSTSGTAAFSVFALQTMSNDSDDETAGADGASNTSNRSATSARISGFNGTTWDRIRTGLVAIASSFTGFLNAIPFAVYNSTRTTRTNGQGGPFESNEAGDLSTTMGTRLRGEDENRDGMHVLNTGMPTRITTATTTACRDSGGSLRRIIVKATLTGTVSIYNHPSTATNLIDVLPIGLPAGTYELGYDMSNGVVLVTSASDNITAVTAR